MPQCVTCRQIYPSNSVTNIFIGVPIPCSICLEDIPSENCWSLPCGHSNCKECFRNIGFTNTPTQPPQEIVNNRNSQDLGEINHNLRCPVTQVLHRFQFDEQTSNYANDIESYKCIDCHILKSERSEIYQQTRRVIRNREMEMQRTCNHQWRRTGGNYAMDITFYHCSVCNGSMTK